MHLGLHIDLLNVPTGVPARKQKTIRVRSQAGAHHAGRPAHQGKTKVRRPSLFLFFVSLLSSVAHKNPSFSLM